MFLHDGTYAHVQLQDDIFRVILQPVTKQVSACDHVCLENIRTAQSIDQPLLRETRTRKLVCSSALISRLATPVKEQEEQTGPHLHDYSTRLGHVNTSVHQLPDVMSKHSARLNIHTTSALQDLSIAGAQVSAVSLSLSLQPLHALAVLLCHTNARSQS